MTDRRELPTIVAVAIIAYACATVVHEGVGHGGACMLVGCKPQLVTSMQFVGDETGLSANARRFVSAGGSIANILAAGLALIAASVIRRRGIHAAWYFCWLLITINLLQPAGYFLYSGATGIGDWAEIIAALHPQWVWRSALILIGAVSYFTVTRWSFVRLAQHLPRGSVERVRDATRLALTAYVTIGVLDLLAGFREPGGAWIVVISGAAASLGGTSGLAWGPQLLHNHAIAPPIGEQLEMGMRWDWILTAALVGLAFVLALGHGIALG